MVITISNQKDIDEKLKGKTIKERVKLSGLQNVIIENVDFCSNDTDHMVQASDLRGCIFRKCKFHGKSTEGCAVNMTGTKTKDNIFEECEWYDLSYNAGNGGEPLRLGLSKQANLFFNTKVRKCSFKNLKADVESVSIKSCGNTVELCKHENCQSSIVVRHGHTNTIQSNEFIGEGGIRLYGKDNKILNNIFKDNKSTRFPPISVVNGNKKDEDLSADYTQVRNNLIQGNVFENCGPKLVVWGRDSRTFKPEGVQFLENRIIAEKVAAKVIEFSGGATPDKNVFVDNVIKGSKAEIDSRIKSAFKKDDVTQPDPVIVPPPPVVEEEPVPQEEPEEPPVVVPVPETEPKAQMCGIHRHAEAKNLLKIYTCTKHAEYLKPRFKKLLEEVMADANNTTTRATEDDE